MNIKEKTTAKRNVCPVPHDKQNIALIQDVSISTPSNEKTSETDHVHTSALELSPLVKGLPILGSALSLKNDPMKFVLKQYRKHGSIFRIKIPGETLVVMAGRDANKFASTTGRDCFSSKLWWGDFAKETGAHKLLTSLDGAEHSKHRKIHKKGYSVQMYTNQLDDIVRATQAYMVGMKENEDINVVRFFRELISIQLGLSMNHYAPRREFDDLLTFIRTLLNTTVVRQWRKGVLKKKKYVKAKANVYRMAEKLIESHKKNKIYRKYDDFIDHLIDVFEKEPDLYSREDQLLAALGPFLAGMDTVANTCAFTLYRLFENPDVMEKVTQEVKEVFSGNSFSIDALRSMPSLHDCILESMRLHPVAPILQRVASQTFEFGGYRVDKGQKILLAATLPHLLEEFYPEPEKFDIMRHRAPRNESRKPYVFAPYGQGPHICLGAKLGEVQIMTIMAILLNTIKVKPSKPNYKLKVVLDPVPTPSNFHIHVLRE